jgi:hypothetical protein
MAVISCSEGSSGAAWVVAGWAFRQVLADVIMLHPEDREMAAIFDRAEAVGYLRIGCLDKPLARRLTAAIRGTASRIMASEIRSGIERFQDEQATQEYLKGLRMLLDTVRVGGTVRPEHLGPGLHT